VQARNLVENAISLQRLTSEFMLSTAVTTADLAISYGELLC